MTSTRRYLCFLAAIYAFLPGVPQILTVRAQGADATQNEAANTQKPSQALSLNISDLPITKFLYSIAMGAYSPQGFEEAAGVKILSQKDSGIFDGFQALAVEYTFGTQKIAIVSFAGTDVLSADILADQRIGLELLINARTTDKAAAQRAINHIDGSFNFLDSQIGQAINFFGEVQTKTSAPIVVTGRIGKKSWSREASKRDLPALRLPCQLPS